MEPVRPPVLTVPLERAGPDPLTALGLAEGTGAGATIWLAREIRAIAQFWLLLPAVKIAAFLILTMLGRLSPVAGAKVAGAVMGLSLVVDGLIWLVPRLAKMAGLAPHRQVMVLIPCTLISACAYTLGLGHLTAPSADGSMVFVTQMGVALVALALIGGQRVLFFTYCVGCAAGMLASIGTLPIILSLGGFLMVMAVALVWQAMAEQHVIMNLQAKYARGLRAESLLSDVETTGKGWFWETDRHGRLTYISPSVAKALGRPMEAILGQPLGAIMGPQADLSGQGGRTLSFHMATHTSFSDIPIQAAIPGEERHWSVSGQAVRSEYGQFQGFRGSGADLTDQRRSEAEKTRLAQYDALTGLSNRVMMMQTLEQSMLGAAGKVSPCALFLLDLDRFKNVNDTLGHPAGDALLRQVAHRLESAVGTQGRVGRLGGDEFKVVLPGLDDRPRLAALAQAIIASLSQAYSIEGSQVVIGASIGIAVSPDDGTTTEALIRNADLALYAAKGDGRGVHRFYAPDMHADAEDRRQLEHDLREALTNDDLSLVYQPVVSALTQKISGFEALLRWTHPKRGPISPALFIPIAEDAGLIASIGEWALRHACAEAATWPGDVRVAVNVSPVQFANPSFASIVMSALANARLSAHRLELEITESVFLNDGAATDAMFGSLKRLGVRLALDDFGTGYSSLGYLKSAPFDKIKIDQSFVRGAAVRGNRNAAIIKSIVSLAEALGMETTAEGAETHDELDLIRLLGCSHIQGYIYGKPMSGADALARLMEGMGQAAPSGFQVHREPRKTMLRSVAVIHDEDRYAGLIRNISSNGALVEGLWNVPVGTIFRIELAEGYEREATARWSAEDRMGVEFDEPIDLELMNPTGKAQPRRAA